MISIADAVLALDATAQISTVSNDANDIIWHDSNPNSITVAQIQTKQAELQTAHDAKAYARTRADAYPSVQDFMEAYTEKEIGSVSTKWDAYVIAYNKVRTDNPK
jgi:hypothetical protein|tara:strand:+ start:289 stop:603 length:315 start_codon:yes stop_codon:yes gene_type:complete